MQSKEDSRASQAGFEAQVSTPRREVGWTMSKNSKQVFEPPCGTQIDRNPPTTDWTWVAHLEGGATGLSDQHPMATGSPAPGIPTLEVAHP